MHRRSRRGMTLVEVMVVVAIVALLSAGAAYGVLRSYEEARVSRAWSDLTTFKSALKTHYVKRGRYPSQEQGLAALVESGSLEEVPKDPWDGEYIYRLEDGRPVIESHGKDGAPGGDGFDADLSTARAGN